MFGLPRSLSVVTTVGEVKPRGKREANEAEDGYRVPDNADGM